MNQETVRSSPGTERSQESCTEIPFCAVLRSDQIEDLVQSGWLISDYYESGQVSPASYDIRLGAEFYQNGLLQNLTDTEENVWIEVPPLDMVYVSSYEHFRMPDDMIGRYSLRLGLMYKGLVLAGGGSQVDPGYEGKLFGLLINFSEESVLLKFKEHWATIEFAPTSFDPTRSKRYKDQEDNYQGTISIGDLFPARKQVDVEHARAVTSALRQAWLQLQKLNAQVPSALEQVNRVESHATDLATELRSMVDRQDTKFEQQAQRLDSRYLAISTEARDAYEAAIDRIESRVNQYAILAAVIFGLTLAAVVVAVFLK